MQHATPERLLRTGAFSPPAAGWLTAEPAAGQCPQLNEENLLAQASVLFPGAAHRLDLVNKGNKSLAARLS